jgi:hypothetical protein
MEEVALRRLSAYQAPVVHCVWPVASLCGRLAFAVVGNFIPNNYWRPCPEWLGRQALARRPEVTRVPKSSPTSYVVLSGISLAGMRE